MVDWDAKWAAGDPEGRLYGAAPNEYLRASWERMARGTPPETALCLADGDGRNGAWLAAQGVSVTAVDLSGVATAQARTHDTALGVSVDRITADAAAWLTVRQTRFELVAIFYLHCPSDSRAGIFAAAAQAVAPGGWLVVEGFATAQAAGRMGPDNPDLLYDVATVAAQAEAGGLTVIEALSGRLRLAEGPKHRGDAVAARLLAQRQ